MLGDNNVDGMDEIDNVRLQKLNTIEQRQGNLYYYNPVPTHTIKYILSNKDKLIEKKVTVNFICRVIGTRNTRMFLTVREEAYKIQCYIDKDIPQYEDRKLIDVGDILYICGVCAYSQTNELTCFVTSFSFVSKCMINAPDDFFYKRVQDKYKVKNRTKYLTFVKDSYDKLYARFYIMQIIRKYFVMNNCIECETPILQNLAGGAFATPFKTTGAIGDMDLRICPELYLKRLIVTGFSRIFEIAKSFRNEGSSVNHCPEFTLLECYLRDFNLSTGIEFCVQLILFILNSIVDIDVPIEQTKAQAKSMLSRHVKYVTFSNILHNINVNVELNKWNFAQIIADTYNLDMSQYSLPDELYMDAVSEYIKRNLSDCIVVLQYLPASISPLAKHNQSNDKVANRFEIYIDGIEVMDGFEENNNYEIQLREFEKQQKHTHKPYDAYYVNDMKMGMPFLLGFGFGIDRFIKMVTNSKNIRDVISYID